MVGTTRFELATSPTPRVRSTRLSHVPTCYDCRPHLEVQTAGVLLVYIKGAVGSLLTLALQDLSAKELRIPWGVRRRCRRRTRSFARRGTPGLRASRAAGGIR